MLTTAARFDLITRDLDRSLANVARQPMVARETDYYREHIGNVSSVADLLGDDRLFAFAMKAHGLADMTYAKAYMRKVLEEGIDNPESFANKLADPRFRNLVEVFNFARYGETATVFDRTQQGTIDKYHQQTLEEDAGAENEAVRLALYFQRKAPEIDGPYDVLADRALLKVVQVALGIPATASQQDIDRQAEAISARIDFADLKDPGKLKAFLARFSNLWDIAQPLPATSVPSVLIGAPLQFGLNADLLTRIQNLKLGGR